MVNNRIAIGDSNDRFSTLSDRERFFLMCNKACKCLVRSDVSAATFSDVVVRLSFANPLPRGVTRNKKVRWTRRDGTGEQIRTRTCVRQRWKERGKERMATTRGKKREEGRKMDKGRTKGVRMRGLERNQLESKGLKKKDARRKNGLIEKKERRRKR